MKAKIKLILFGLSAAISAAIIIIWFFWEIPLLSPLTEHTTFSFLDKQRKPQIHQKKIVYGFLPYWNLDDVTIHPELTHLSYFGLTIGPDGQIITKTEDGGEPGYSKLDSEKLMELTQQVEDNQNKIEITLIQFNGDDIVSFINNQEAQQRLIQSLDSILLAYPVSGVNIDIEYAGKVSPRLRSNFTRFVQGLSDHLDQKYKGINLSIDMYASASSKRLIWDVPAIAKEVDYIVVMAYDFHRRSSTQAGPVAPLFGGNQFWENDINAYLKDFLAVVPKEKILLGIPFYGYQWQTDSRNPTANTYPGTGSTVKMVDVSKLLDKSGPLQLETHWDEMALSPYLTYIEDGKNYVAYFENQRSISYKLDYVNELDLAGIAIWALGYEGNSRRLWETIGSKLR